MFYGGLHSVPIRNASPHNVTVLTDLVYVPQACVIHIHKHMYTHMQRAVIKKSILVIIVRNSSFKPNVV